MARSKHSVALFEVIQSNRASRSGMSLSTPKWWFKRRTAAAEAIGGSVSSAPAVATLPPPPTVPAALEPRNIDTAPAHRAPAVDMMVDSDRQRITFNITYSSAVVTAFSVLVVVALAYAIGQHVKQGPNTALAGPPIEQIKQGSVNAAAMNVGASWGTPAAAPQRAAQPPVQQDVEGQAPAPVPVAKPAAGNVAPTISPSGERVKGLNYIVVQGYPPEEKAMAQEACDLLNKNGIPVTLETNLEGFNRSWFIVVTTSGFDRISGQDYGNYEKAIRTVGEKFGKTKGFKKFEPMAKKWK